MAPVIATVACFGSWATSGMETSLVTAAGLWMILELDSLGTHTSWARAWLVPALSVLFFAASRPEAPIIVGSVVLGGIVAMLLRKSETGAYAVGYEAARDRYENAAATASWANTPEGQLAYGLAKAGSLRELATCSGHGWFERDGICYPGSKTHGWRLPAGNAKR